MNMTTSIMDLEMSQGDALLAIAIALLVAFLLRMMNKLMQCSTPFHATINSIEECFPNAMTNDQLCKLIKRSLEKHGYGQSSLVATSICCDEVNRTLEKDLAGLYGSYFSMGGLAGCKC